MTRLNRSDQVSSAATRRPAALSAEERCAASVEPSGRDGGEQVDAGKAGKRLGDAQALGFEERIGLAAPVGETPGARRLGGERQDRGAIAHQRLVGFAGPVPFEHREFGMVQRPALAVAVDMGEAGNPRLARGQQLLAGEFRRGVQVEGGRVAARRQRFRGEGMEMGLVAGRDLQRRRIDLHEIALREIPPHCVLDAVARQQKGTPVRMDVRVPPRRGCRAGLMGGAGWPLCWFPR